MKTQGITVLPEYIQSDGIEPLLDRLQGAGFNAVTTSPYVMEPADEATGSREPPVDAGAGKVRLLDRPLWGRQELWVRTAPSFVPDLKRYEGLRYQPPCPEPLTHEQGRVVSDFLDSAKQRGLRVNFQVMAAIPPGYRVQFGGPVEDDLPRMPDGRVPEKRVANNGSLASSHILAYGAAMLGDLCTQYPQLDGIRIDWPEYPPYSLDDCFTDFSEPAEHAAAEMGIDFAAIRHDTQTFYDFLHGELSDSWLDHLTTHRDAALAEIIDRYPGLLYLSRFKASLSVRLMARYRQAMNEAAASQMELLANLFPWPWSIASGAGIYADLGGHCQGLLIKLYGMHWKMMVRSYFDQLRAANPQVDRQKLLRAIVSLLDIADEGDPLDPESFRYPGPDEPHGISRAVQHRKIKQTQSWAGDTPVYTLAHSYGPVADFRDRWATARTAAGNGVWLNRYAYVSDEKLATLSTSR